MKATKTNHLGSHHGESNSSRADKMPRPYFGEWGATWKKFLRNKTRGFLKGDLHNQMTDGEYEPKI
jgi:hypothetical protein